MSATTQSPRNFELEISAHARRRWEKRSSQRHLDPRAAWSEAEPVHYPSLKPPSEHARYHESTDLVLLVAQDGTMTTCIPLSDRSPDEQQYVRNQVTDQ
ncbi:hypothetical protein HYG81_18860 [Natrinema zhouii]|uniref:hypothetical protein n=1 Tax=Natrinema zhouii TaxID=1710539 RepID=UPI001CFFD76C|nr:hypothetical protein [Natrinema zhouii]UHQ97923.1 hypothetical protein HYG81_18860 [Natrinema zhouii]